MSNPGTPPLPRPEALKKLAQLRIERLKKEEEEEQWISGEELYTEGSSDEDDSAVRGKRKTAGNEKHVKKSSRNVGSKPKKIIKEENKRTHNYLSPPEVNFTCCAERKEGDENIVVDAGLEKESFQGLTDADQAYCTVIKRVKKLKTILMGESSSFSSIIEGKMDNGFNSLVKGVNTTNTAIDLHKIFSCDWNFLQEKYDLESALSNIKMLDLLLEIIDNKQKEVHEETMNVQLQIQDELNKFIINKKTDDDITNNITSFLRLCLHTKNKDSKKGIKRSRNGLGEYKRYVKREHTKQSDAIKLALVDKNFKFEEPLISKNSFLFKKKLNSEIGEDIGQVFSLTDYEKQRLALLLQDDVTFQLDKNIKKKEDFYIGNIDLNRRIIYHEPYAFNQETKLNLETINDKLKAFSEMQHESATLQKLRNPIHTILDLSENGRNIYEARREEQLIDNIDILLESLNFSDDKIAPLRNQQNLMKTQEPSTHIATYEFGNLNSENFCQVLPRNGFKPDLPNM